MGSASSGGVTADAARQYTATPSQIADEPCSVCLDELRNGEETVELRTCTHQIHFLCFVNMLQSSNRRSCTVCNKFFAAPQGNMPVGTMAVTHDATLKLPGYESAAGTIIITYHFGDGVQGPMHIRPGVAFTGTTRTCYLPDNEQGNKVLELLRKAFDHKLTFTIGDSITSGKKNTVVFNNIHHKMKVNGGSTGFGYPDMEYLSRVTKELALLGIV